MNIPDQPDLSYKIGLLEESRTWEMDLLIEIYAQLTRFVVRKQMTELEASVLAISMAKTMCEELGRQIEEKEKREQKDLADGDKCL